MRHDYKVVGTINVHFIDEGKGEPCLLLLHGWGSDSGTWHKNIPSLSTQARVIALDLPGFGLSDPLAEAWSVQDFADFTISFLNVMNIDETVIVGRSFGGRVAIKLAACYPTRVLGLILVNSAGLLAKDTLKYWMRKGLSKMGKLAFSLKFLEQWREEAQRVLYMGRVSRRGSYDVSIETFKRVASEDLSSHLKRIRVPTLLIWGANDTIVPLRYGKKMLGLLQCASLQVIRGVGHQSHLEDPQTFNELVAEYAGEASCLNLTP